MKFQSTMTDQQLVLLNQSGDENALGTLIERYKDKIFSSIFLLVKDRYLAEDLFQDVFIKVIETLRNGKYNDEGKFLPWVMRIAHNLCVDHFRRIKRKPTIKTSDDRDIFEVLNFNDESTETKIVIAETHDTVKEMLDRLPEDQREVIILRHYADLSFKEISQLTNISINTALGRMRYGLINLRKIMEEKNIAL